MVAVERPDMPSLIRTTFPAPARDRCWSAMKESTSFAVTSAGSLPTNPKKTFRSWA